MTKKYALKPGKHQFAPGSPAEHDNDNLTDEAAEWYLKAYPHIAALFEKSPKVGKTESPKGAASESPKVKRTRIVKNQPVNLLQSKSIGEITLISEIPIKNQSVKSSQNRCNPKI